MSASATDCAHSSSHARRPWIAARLVALATSAINRLDALTAPSG